MAIKDVKVVTMMTLKKIPIMNIKDSVNKTCKRMRNRGLLRGRNGKDNKDYNDEDKVVIKILRV